MKYYVNFVMVRAILCYIGTSSAPTISRFVKITFRSTNRACESGNLATVKFLIHECECDVNASNSEFKQPLHVACIQGSEEVVSLLLESGSDVNSLKRNRWTALMHASSHGHASVVKLLIEKGARVEESNREGATAL